MNKLLSIVGSILMTFSAQCQSRNTDDSLHILSIWDEVDLKAESFMEDNTPERDLNKIDSDFLNFYKRFISDSTYQKDHINFETIVGVIGECDTTILVKELNWAFTNWDFTEFFDQNNNPLIADGWDNTFHQCTGKFYYKFHLNEVGDIYEVGFEQIDGEWMLTLYYENAC